MAPGTHDEDVICSEGDDDNALFCQCVNKPRNMLFATGRIFLPSYIIHS